MPRSAGLFFLWIFLAGFDFSGLDIHFAPNTLPKKVDPYISAPFAFIQYRASACCDPLPCAQRFAPTHRIGFDVLQKKLP